MLRATSAVRAYHHVYRGDYTAWGIAEFLVLNTTFPRSANFCFKALERLPDGLGRLYGERHACHETVAEMVRRLDGADIQSLFQSGLHEFIGDAIKVTNRLSNEISRAYYF